MTEQESPSLFDRALSNLSASWRDISVSAARTVGLSVSDEAVADAARLQTQMKECLEARGGEVSARVRAASLGRAYLQLDAQGRALFLEVLARDFAVEEAAVTEAIADYQAQEDEQGRIAAGLRLREVLEPPRVRLLHQFNSLPEGVKFLVDMRADLLPLLDRSPHLRALDQDLQDLLTSWFDSGFIDLRRITWESSAALLEKLIAYEAVHEIQSWDDLRNRLDSDRRCYALFHPRMPNEPLAFVEVALVEGIAGNVQDLLDENAPAADPAKADSAIFYSISNTQRGLRGITFGDFLIKMVVRELSQDLPRIKTFATLSPVPGLRVWLEGVDGESLDRFLGSDERSTIRKLGQSDDTAEALKNLLARENWHRHAKAAESLKDPLLRLAARYFMEKRGNGQPIDPVARFHLRNGARLERINWLGDTSAKGLRQSAGIMVNYRYLLDDIEKNHEAYVAKGTVAVSSDVRSLMRRVRDSSSGTLRRLGLG
ncbi:malonyl-CoA decarboxylase [Aquibaculum sediminis]|uniref:malonyl-CoA decarboxylase n=1 Tax=Aquibaculum sediminis TaxID=3231907 RepID=UPI0034567B64